MKIGFIGCGVVGGTTRKWILRKTPHEVASFDPGKGMFDKLTGCDAIFISIPISPEQDYLSDISELRKAIHKARTESPEAKIIIRSTVKPGTNDFLGTFSMPEFLTERHAEDDMNNLPIVTGCHWDGIEKIFIGKEIIRTSNTAAEIAKLAHNCFGAMKVTYWNIIYNLCESMNVDYAQVIKASMITGYIEPQHTQVPGHDGKFGWGGKCFPVNVRMMEALFAERECTSEALFFDILNVINKLHRYRQHPAPEATV